ncbi:MAG: hypothetical protein U9O98_08900, partial [Asgard group archaeon]|nr:hypothetical protein [Asgard group archaeon]
QTNTTGYVTILYSVENCTVGTFIETHFFMPAPYETCYEGNSSLGNTMISKGELNVTFESMEVKWLNKVQLQTRVTSLGVGWGNIIADFYCFIDSQWIFLGSEITNETGYAILIWEQVNLTIGTYPIKVEIIESDYFQSKISFSNLKVERQSIEIYIIENGIMKGAGETIDVEYLSKMELVFFVKYGSDQPVVDKIIQIKGRLAGESYYTILGYITTNQSGYGVFVSYEELTLVGFAYSCIAEIQQTSFHEASLFHFKINLVKCTPYILLEEQSFERGTEIGLFALVVNAENTSLTGVSIIFTIGSESIQTITNAFGFAYVVFDTDLLVGEYQLTCDSLANPYFNAATNETMITITRGSLDITLYDSAALKSGYLTIEALILDSLGRPVPNISVNLSIVSWNEIVTSNQYGCITYTVKAANFGYGYHLLLLSFLGDAEWFETTVTARVLIYYEDVNLYFTDHSFTCIYNDQITVEVFLTTLTDAPLADRTLEFLAYFSNGTIITLGYGKTGVNGRLETSLLLAIKPGNYDLGVKYEGSVDYGPAISFAEVIVTKSAIQIIADDFEVIQNSLASYQLTIIDFLGKPVANLDISLYLWINNQWQYLTKATTNEFGVAVFSIACPSTLGIYDIKISFSGNLFYHENYQIQEMTVIEPPPKVEPIISANDYSIALYQNVSIQITISNYIPGTVVTLFVYINNNYTETIFIHDGLGHYQVVFTSIGLNNITFIAMEDAVYTSAVKTIFITVTPNPPPILQNFHYEEYVCEGEAFTFEASIIDASGIDIVLLILNGTNFHLQQETGSFFKITIPSLRAGYYHAEIFARDLQGNIIRESLPEHIEILEAKTQIIDYTPLNLIFEKGEIVSMEFFIYSETKIESITLYLNDTSYLLTKTYEITIHKTVWCFTSEKIPQGNYLLSIKISEQNSKDTTFTLQQSLIIIPSCPEIQNNQWRIITKGSQDIIQGNFTIFSFYEIQIVTVWLDGQQLSLHQISTRIYGFNASVPHAKTHELRIKIIDVNGRIFEETYKLGGIILNPNIKIFVIIVSVILLLLLIGGFVLIRKHIRKRNVENPPIISVPEIYDDMDSLEASSSSRDSTDQVPSVVQSSSSPVSQPSQNGNRLRQASERLSSSQQKNTEQNLKPKSERQQIDQQELAVFNVKEYIQKVEQEGLFDYIKEEGKPEKDSTNGDQDSDKESLPTTIDTMSSFSIDIDERLLPEKEQKKIHEQKRKDTASLSKDLRAITEEIEGTFKPK